VGEIALALVLMTGAVLFVRSARNLASIDPGFDVRGLQSARVSLAGSRYQSPAQIASGIARLLASVSALPQSRAVAATTGLPLGNGVPDVQLHIAGREFLAGQEPAANFLSVSPTYFETMGIPIVRGRALNSNDRTGAPPVVVINEALAHHLWPNESPLGKRFYCCQDTVRVWREIVGVSRNVRHWLTARPFAEIYVPYEQAPAASWVWFSNTVTLVIRTERSDAVLPRQLRAAIEGVDPSLPLFEQFSYDDLWRRSTSTNRFAMLLFTAFAALALTLAAIGIYGVLAYLVSHRTQEIAVRMALGATRRQVFTLILRQGGTLAAGGILLGTAIAVVSSRALQQLLYGIEPTDPITYAIAALALAAVAIAACYIPARRAASVEPYNALRG
jgi:putative ABC transport system permease protein